MLLYYLFCMFTSFIIHFYIIFGTNLLIGGPSHIVVLLPVSIFRRKEISNGVQTEWNLRERDFWKGYDPGDLEFKPGKVRGSQETGGATRGVGAPPCLVPRSLLSWRGLQVSRVAFLPKITSPEGFILFQLRLIFLFFETLKQGKKQELALGSGSIG